MTKITIISGFLGAGKTTLIRKLLTEAYRGEKTVLIENEFGEIGIDSGFLQDAGVEVRELNSGCICCTLVGDFEAALAQVLERYAPARILIEPSGVGKLSDVLAAVRRLPAEVELTGFAVVADATKCKLYLKNFGEFYRDQIAHASAIVLSRTEGMEADKLAQAVALLRAENPAAPIVTTPWEALTGAQLADAVEQRETLANALHTLEQKAHAGHGHHGDEHTHAHGAGCACGQHGHDRHGEAAHAHGAGCACGQHGHDHHGEAAHAHGHDADAVFQSFGAETPRAYSRAELESCLRALDSGDYGTVLRAKGMVAASDGTWLHFDFVPGEQNIRAGIAGVTGRVCVIGTKLNEPALRELLWL